MEQYTSWLLPLGFLGVFYFFLIRPQQKKEKKIKEMRSALKVGEMITTIGGIYGKIVNLKEDYVTIEVGSEKTKIVVTRWAIGSIVEK
ncbi:MAG: preprotein translocase subunit YajC [Clostridiales bacterium]|nr:preprotein translocase subunit YajC [Clostridiales bacterium]